MDEISIYKKFKTHQDCLNYLEWILWDGVPKCPYCSSKRQTLLETEDRYHCNNCRRSYSVTARTMFHKTKVDLQKWFVAIDLVLNQEISARKLAKTINVTKDTACFLIKRINNAKIEEPKTISKLIKFEKGKTNDKRSNS